MEIVLATFVSFCAAFKGLYALLIYWFSAGFLPPKMVLRVTLFLVFGHRQKTTVQHLLSEPTGARQNEHTKQMFRFWEVEQNTFRQPTYLEPII